MIMWEIIAGMMILVLVLSWLPVRGLSYLSQEKARELVASREEERIKVLDVRDASDYEEAAGFPSINMSIGRLPYLWKDEFSPEDRVLLVGDSNRHIKKAARFLKRRGFKGLYAMQLRPELRVLGTCREKTCGAGCP
ncbi:rhodanese-like domain-containing protein [Paenibacillus chitinolyticus]|uniref:rhodanese-like domain-containing protein n=1 Tax=Paenibacillus chitinolyticus TaxID=79263 RepID=UPI00365C1649